MMLYYFNDLFLGLQKLYQCITFSHFHLKKDNDDDMFS